jgi:hypothetical protein
MKSTRRSKIVPAVSLPGVLLLVFVGSPAGATEPNALTFEQDIRPLFRAHCYDCHGASEDVEGGLDLRLVRFIREGGDSGPAIGDGSPDDSLLLERVRHGEMPPGQTRLAADELATLERWITAGAPTARPEPETIGPGLGITPEERSFWSFQPIQRPSLPPQTTAAANADELSAIDLLYLQDAGVVTTSDDAALAGSEAPPLGLAPQASRATLVQRAYFDLLGLPPTPEAMQRWGNNPDPDWYDQLLSHLLDSPHYGERWARHWLDVAGYADSEGYTTQDAPRPWAWKYRDWVIRALNEDRPFDQFVTEQLAGDELAGPIEGDLTPQQIELLTATGYLRMAADGTGSGANDAEARNQVVADTLKIVGTSLLGLSLQCAQCHDHRYDPIPQTDYFAIRAVFEPALDWQAWKVPDARRVSLYTAAERERAAAIEADVQRIAEEKQAKRNEYMATALAQKLEEFEEPLRGQLRTAYQTPADQRTETQKSRLRQHPSVNITPGNLYQYIPDSRPKLAEYDQRIADVRARKPPETFVRALVEPANHIPETKLFHRGDHRQPQQTILPTALTVACPEDATVTFPTNDPSRPTSGRRLAFARWLTDRNNPLLARVIVNRVWMHHFGTGLVTTPADFGRLGSRPSHPALLDWLASEFVAQGWSLKKLHRIIMTSRLWKQSRERLADAPARLVSQPSDAPNKSSGEAMDQRLPAGPFNRLMRLEAETLRDYMLATTGQLDRAVGGPPLAIKEDGTGQTVVAESQVRRSVYVQVRRSQPVAMLQTFDAPVMATNCEVRSSSTVATQSLMLLNGQFILHQAGKLADRAAADPVTEADGPRELFASAKRSAEPEDSSATVLGQILRVWQLAYLRDPTPAELALATDFVETQIETLEANPAAVPAGRTVTRQAMTNLSQALLSSNEFLYVE